MQRPGFWDDQSAAAEISAKHARAQRRLEGFRGLESDVADLGELAELAYLALREMNMTLVGFVDGKQHQVFLSYPVWTLNTLANWEYDALLIADLVEREKIHARILREGVPKAKIMAL